ncbi:MAG: hypothetical protein ACK4SA_23150 [Caldilinea sp.]
MQITTVYDLSKLAFIASILLIVFSIGLANPPGTIRAGLRQPWRIGRAMLAMFVALPLFTLVVTSVLRLDTASRVALLALSVSPMPPIMSLKARKLGGQLDYALTIHLAAVPVALLAAPVLVWLAELLFGRHATIDELAELRVLLITMVVPLLLGIGLAHATPRLAESMARPARLLGSVLLVAGVAAIFWRHLPAILEVAIGPISLAIASMTVFGLWIGYSLGGPDRGNRHALAIATASRHPGVAIAMIATVDLAARQPIVTAIILYVIVTTILCLPYRWWAKR